MDTNVGTTDQRIRIAGLVIAVIFYLTHRDGSLLSNTVGFFAVYLFMTALTRYSPVWDLLGISTEKPREKKV